MALHLKLDCFGFYSVSFFLSDHFIIYLLNDILLAAPLETIGLFGFAWCSLGPPVHWMGCMIFAACIAIANYAIYMATIDYMVRYYKFIYLIFRFI